ncbi:hypothetical protein [Streptomyces sp. CO7]
MTTSPPHSADDAAAAHRRLTILLERAARGPQDGAWSELWTELYHNGSLDTVSPAALRGLAELAEGEDPGIADSALHLAGAFLIQADQRHETASLRDALAPEVARLLAAAHRRRSLVTDDGDYCYLLEVVLNLEGQIDWAEDLFRGLCTEEWECEPEGCEGAVWVVVGERGYFSCAEDYALSEDVTTFPLHPADPSTLQGVGHRLHELALADGHGAVAHRLTYAFGEATCPYCGRRFSVSDTIAARSC